MAPRLRRASVSAKAARQAAVVAAARRLTIPVPSSVLARAVPELRGTDLAETVSAGWLLADDRGYVYANPVMAMQSPADAGRLSGPRAAVRLARALGEWLEHDPYPRDAEMVETARLSVLAGDERMAAAWLDRLAHAAIVSGTAPGAAAALLASGLVGEFVRAAREPTLLLLVDGGRFAEARSVLRPEERWLAALLAVREERPKEAFSVLPPSARGGLRESIVLARAAIDLFDPPTAVRLLEPHYAAGRASSPGLEGQLLELVARAYRLASRNDDAGVALDRLASLADRLGEGRFLPAVHMGRALHASNLGRAREARSHLAKLHESLGRLPPSRYQARADLLEAVLDLWAGNHAATAAMVRRALSAERPDFRDYWIRLDAEERTYRSDCAGARSILSALTISSPTSAALRVEIAVREGDPQEVRRALEDPQTRSADGRVALRWALWLLGDAVPEPGDDPPSLFYVARSRLLEAERALEKSDLAAASALAKEALGLVEAHDLGLHAADALLVLADAAARGGAVDDARRLVARAADRISHPDSPAARLVVAARHVLEGTSPSDAEWDAWAAKRDWRALGLVARGRTDLRANVAHFLAGIPPRFRAIAEAAFPAEAPDGALFVGPDARWFRLGKGERVDLGRRRAVRLLLLRLAQARQSEPGRALSMDDLLAAGWAGERVLPEAGWNRVYVSLHTLRGLGLETAILTRDDGWLLDPSLAVIRVAGPTREGAS